VATWSDVGVVAVGGGIGVVGTYIGAHLQMVNSRSERRAGEHAARVARFAEVLGPIRAQLLYTDPTPFVFASMEAVEEQRRIWAPLLERLEFIAAAEPSVEMREMIRELENEMGKLLWGLSLMVSPELRQRQIQAGNPANPFEVAERHHQEAERLADAILSKIHEETDDTEPTGVMRKAGSVIRRS